MTTSPYLVPSLKMHVVVSSFPPRALIACTGTT